MKRGLVLATARLTIACLACMACAEEARGPEPSGATAGTADPEGEWQARRTRLRAALPPIDNVILISIDTLRADHLGCYGNPVVRTPHLDAIAQAGVLFASHMSSAPSTLCSHTSLMTGTYPHTHGTPRNGFEVPADNVMLAEILRDAGFVTAGFIGAYPLRSKFGFAQGFQTYDDDESVRSGAEVNASVAGWLEERPAGPLFLFVHYWDAHLPYDPPQPYRDMYRTDDLPMKRTKEEIEEIREAMYDGRDESARSAALAALYAGGVSYVDQIVGELIDLLAEHELLETSLLVITSDHGEAMDEHWEFWDHGESTYDTTVHTPLILRLPGAHAAGLRRTEVVSNVDVVPSILELLDLPRSAVLEGTSFVDLLGEGEAEPRPPAFSEGTKPHDRSAESLAWANAKKCRAVRDGNWKLVQRPLLDTMELYELGTDPMEQHDVFEREKGARWLKRLRRELAAWSTVVPDRTGTQDRSEETLRALEALGYVESQ